MPGPRKTLRDALNLFNPSRSLEDGELDTFYVKRPHAPLDPLRVYLQASTDPVKVLFSGHRGSGKTAELRKLARVLTTNFFIVPVSAAAVLNVADLNHLDVTLACMSALLREVSESMANWVDVPDQLLEGILSYLTTEITNETTITTVKSGAIGARIKPYIASLEAKYGKETQTRTSIRQRLAPKLTDLIDQVNGICGAIRTATNSAPLIIVEDLDKTNLKHARDLFFDHSSTLNSLSCHMIYTFPISLCYAPAFTERIGDYSAKFLLPNATVRDRAGNPDAEGLATLRSVVTQRVSEELFVENALDQLLYASGGLMRDLVRLVRDSALIGLTAGATAITEAMAQAAVDERSNEFRRLLRPQDYAALHLARQTKSIVPDEVGQQLCRISACSSTKMGTHGVTSTLLLFPCWTRLRRARVTTRTRKNNPVLDRLITLLENVDEGAFAIVLYDRAPVRRLLVSALKARLSRNLFEAHLSDTESNPVDVIRNLHAPPGSVVCLFNLEKARPEVFGYLDLQREVVADMRLSVVVWANEYEYSQLAERSPNFFSFSSGVFDFTETREPISPQRDAGFYTCFLSYSHEDNDFARRLYGRLRHEGLRVWYAPADIEGERSFYDQIATAIRFYDRLLLVLSDKSIESEWVRTEIRSTRRAELAQRRQKLFPIRLCDYEKINNWSYFDANTGKDLGVELREYTMPDFTSWHEPGCFEQAFQNLLEAMRNADTAKQPAIIGAI